MTNPTTDKPAHEMTTSSSNGTALANEVWKSISPHCERQHGNSDVIIITHTGRDKLAQALQSAYEQGRTAKAEVLVHCLGITSAASQKAYLSGRARTVETMNDVHNQIRNLLSEEN